MNRFLSSPTNFHFRCFPEILLCCAQAMLEWIGWLSCWRKGKRGEIKDSLEVSSQGDFKCMHSKKSIEHPLCVTGVDAGGSAIRLVVSVEVILASMTNKPSYFSDFTECLLLPSPSHKDAPACWGGGAPLHRSLRRKLCHLPQWLPRASWAWPPALEMAKDGVAGMPGGLQTRPEAGHVHSRSSDAGTGPHKVPGDKELRVGALLSGCLCQRTLPPSGSEYNLKIQLGKQFHF